MTRSAMILIPLLAATFSCSSGPNRKTTLSRTTSKVALPRELSGVGNFAKVDDGLFRGEQPDSEGFATLEDLGVKTVINLRNKSTDRALIAGTELDLIELPVNPGNLEEAQVLTFMKIATDPRRRPVFVHCRHGADRTGTMVAVYRMVAQEWPREEALAELSRFGFHRVWVNLKRYVRRVDPASIRSRYPSAKVPPVFRGQEEEWTPTNR